MDKDYNPATLPDVDEVEIVNVSNIKASTADYLSQTVDRKGMIVTGERCAKIAALWRSLPPKGQMRCHLPPYELRFKKNGETLLRATVCWQCNNLGGIDGTVPFWYCFNGSSPEAKNLLWLISDLELEQTLNIARRLYPR